MVVFTVSGYLNCSKFPTTNTRTPIISGLPRRRGASDTSNGFLLNACYFSSNAGGELTELRGDGTICVNWYCSNISGTNIWFEMTDSYFTDD